MEIKALLLGETNTKLFRTPFQYIEELTLVKFKNGRYMWKIKNYLQHKTVLNSDVYLRQNEVSRFGSFYFFKIEHLSKTTPFTYEELNMRMF